MRDCHHCTKDSRAPLIWGLFTWLLRLNCGSVQPLGSSITRWILYSSRSQQNTSSSCKLSFFYVAAQRYCTSAGYWAERRHGSARVPGHGFFAWRIAHDGFLCTFSNRSAPEPGKWCGPSGQAAWTVHHKQNHIPLDHSPPASQADRRIGPAL